jgi:hypothetical protein
VIGRVHATKDHFCGDFTAPKLIRVAIRPRPIEEIGEASSGAFFASQNAVPSRSIFGDLVLVAFFGAQVCDGALTYLGILSFGLAVEANPVVSWYMAAFGGGVALVGAKAMAVACGSLLHVRSMHRTIGVLAIVYYGVAVLPWTRVLWP